MARVLVIDDAADIRVLLTKSLERAGHQVAAAASADEGLAELRRSRIDVVLLDLEMPVKDGVACLATIRSDQALARTPVVMVTGTPLREVVQRVVQLGVQGIVIKKDNWVPGLVEQVGKLLTAAPPSAAAPPTEVSASSSAPAAAARASAGPGGALAGGFGPAVPSASAAPSAASKAAPASVAAGTSGSRLVVESWSSPVISDAEGAMTGERAMELLKSLKPMIARSELLEKMLAEAASVPAIRPAVQQVLRLTERAESSIQTIANAVRQDQALSLRILRMANSSLYAHGERVDSVAKAISRIGLAQIRDVVLSVAIVDAFGTVAAQGSFRPDWFWEHATACGLLATRLAQACGRPKDYCETMFTAGLLHDLGRLLFAEHLPEHYPKVVETAERLELPLETVESRLLLLNHADITDRLLRHWKFPASLIAPVAMHHLSVGNITAAAPRSANDVVPLALANRLAHAMLMGSSGNEVLYPLEDFVDHLRLDAGRIAEICGNATTELADLRLNMLMHSGESGHPYVDAVRARLGDVRPLTLALQPATDPMSIMVGMLLGGAEPAEPNLITLRIRTPSERAGAMRLLDEALSSADVAMPVLVLGNSRACLLGEGSLGGRPTRQVTLPLGLGRLLREMQRLTGISPQ
jgi:HD-like signal output (HDOD) protein/CheY-like chemotaxis protein